MNSRRNKLWKIVLASVFGIIVISVALNMIVHHKIEKLISQKIPDYYNIQYHKISVNLLKGSLQIDSLEINSLTDSINNNIPGLMKGNIAKLSIKGIAIIPFLWNHTIRVEQLQIIHPQLHYLANSKYEKDTTTLKKETFLPKGINGITVHRLDIEQADIDKSTVELPDSNQLSINNLNLNIKSLKLRNPSKRTPAISYNQLRINSLAFDNGSSDNYSIHLDSLSFVSTDEHLLISKFQLMPKFAKSELRSHSTFETDLFAIQLDSISLYDIDVEKMLKRNQIHIPKLLISNPDISIYRDKRMPDAPYKYKPLIVSAIKKIPIETTVDSIIISSGKLTYEEHAENQHPPGKIFFNLQQIDIAHVSNIASEMKTNPQMTIHLDALLMGKGQIESTLKFDLNSKYEHFSTEGVLHSIDASALNSVTENLLDVKVLSGEIDEVHFNFNANDELAEGSLSMQYENLKVQIMNPEGKDQALISWVANGIIKQDNLSSDKKYRTGNIYFERLKDKGFPNYLWKSISSGIIPIVAPIAGKNKK